MPLNNPPDLSKEADLAQRLSSQEMELVTRVHILDNALWVPLRAHALGKRHESVLPRLAQAK